MVFPPEKWQGNMCVCVCVFHLPRTSLNRLSVCRTFRLASTLWPTLEVSPLPPSADLPEEHSDPPPRHCISRRNLIRLSLAREEGEKSDCCFLHGRKVFLPPIVSFLPLPPCSTFVPAVSGNASRTSRATGRRGFGCSLGFRSKLYGGEKAEKQPF